jgi:hypothetical protein
VEKRVGVGDYTWNSAFDANLTGHDGGLYFGGVDAVTASASSDPHTPRWIVRAGTGGLK